MLHLKKEDDYTRSTLHGTSEQRQLLNTVRQEIEAATWEAAVGRASAEESPEVPEGFVEVEQCQRISFELRAETEERLVKIVGPEPPPHCSSIIFFTRPCTRPFSHHGHANRNPSVGTGTSNATIGKEKDGALPKSQDSKGERTLKSSTAVQVYRVSQAEWMRVQGILDDDRLVDKQLQGIDEDQLVGKYASVKSRGSPPQNNLVCQEFMHQMRDVTVVIDYEEREELWWDFQNSAQQPREVPAAGCGADVPTPAHHRYCLHSWEPSPDGRLVAFTEGYERKDGLAEEPWALQTGVCLNSVDILHAGIKVAQAQAKEWHQDPEEAAVDVGALGAEYPRKDEEGRDTRWGRMVLHVVDASTGKPVLPPV
jgi:hypothetical protein